jgi:hypothetical protein
MAVDRVARDRVGEDAVALVALVVDVFDDVRPRQADLAVFGGDVGELRRAGDLVAGDAVCGGGVLDGRTGTDPRRARQAAVGGEAAVHAAHLTRGLVDVHDQLGPDDRQAGNALVQAHVHLSELVALAHAGRKVLTARGATQPRVAAGERHRAVAHRGAVHLAEVLRKVERLDDRRPLAARRSRGIHVGVSTNEEKNHSGNQ